MSAASSNVPLECDDDPARFAHRYLATNGIGMHFMEQGNGPLIVLLHGFPYLWYMWRHQIPALELFRPIFERLEDHLPNLCSKVQ